MSFKASKEHIFRKKMSFPIQDETNLFLGLVMSNVLVNQIISFRSTDPCLYAFRSIKYERELIMYFFWCIVTIAVPHEHRNESILYVKRIMSHHESFFVE